MTDATVMFAQCATAEEAKELCTDLNRDANELIRGNRKLMNHRIKELRRAELDVFHQDAKNWKHGTKVYFGKSCNSIALDWNFRAIKESEKKIEKGDWCYVWQYQPRAKRLWLCRPGTKCEYQNVISDHFSLTDIEQYQISRTELDLRK